MKQFHVTFIDNSQDWVDPVESMREDEYKIIINNGWYEYSFDKYMIKHYEIIDVED